MTRFKTCRTSFTSLPNKVIQGFYLSPEALTILITCLSYPDDWKYRPITIWQQLKISRNKTYEAFEELIKAGHCIRILKKNGNLNGEVEYIFYDDPVNCEEHIRTKMEEFLEEAVSVDFRDEFKKFLRHSNDRDAEGGQPQPGENSGIYTYKKKKISLKEDHHHHASSSFTEDPPNPKKNDDDDLSKKKNEKAYDIEVVNTKGQRIGISYQEIYQKLPRFDRSIIKEAIDKMLSMETPINSIVGYLESTCISIENQRSQKGNPEKPKIDEQEVDEDVRIAQNQEDAVKFANEFINSPEAPNVSFGGRHIEFRHLRGFKILFNDKNFTNKFDESIKSYRSYVAKLEKARERDRNAP